MSILLFNAGSSSLKVTLMGSTDGAVLARGHADWAGSTTRYQYSGAGDGETSLQVPWTGYAAAVHHFVEDLKRTKPRNSPDGSRLAAVGHRVVHGGPFTSSVRITDDVRAQIGELADLAPLHNPPSLETLAAAKSELSDVPHVAVFDTAFHATLPPKAFTYPVPDCWTREWGIRRYGFHGLSHAYCARRAADMLNRPLEELQLVICHLGHGCSASAVQAGRCVDTTMGFTPLDGLMMATRSGSIDPGIVLHVQQQHGLTPAAVETALNCESGLLGISGISADMRQVLEAHQAGNERAALALAVYAHRVRQAVGALAVTMGRVDALVFTAGVGEHASVVREMVCEGLQCLGLELDPGRNHSGEPDADVSRNASPGRILIVRTREDLTMFEEVQQVLNDDQQNIGLKEGRRLDG